MAVTPGRFRNASARRRAVQSRRFLSADQRSPADQRSSRPHDEGQRTRGAVELFAEGQWPVIRVQLELQGWCQSQIDLVHDQLRQGWPLETAKQHATRLSGHCPIKIQPGL